MVARACTSCGKSSLVAGYMLAQWAVPMNTKNESCIFITTSSFFCRFLMAGLRKYPQILEIVHLIFICYLFLWSYENFLLWWSGMVTRSFKLGVSERCLTISFCYEPSLTCIIKIKHTLNINGWWLRWQIFSESKEVPGINGSIWEDYLCGLHPIASIVRVGLVDSHLDQFLVEFGSKHIHTLLNWKPVNTRQICTTHSNSFHIRYEQAIH